ncbi:D-lactate dehydrogenase [synthetic Mycoplasma mycoides JCVI-syn1.0]|uniref:Lactate dehydrogenase n=1 Tax=Mycoplasma mycoides subsp. capri TaxID=40477 RepID=A0AB38GG45_MYCMC|nr:2-hydroxyacid dehydrogenase [Mycoplasma mycoides]ADH21649.1 D-lactate dehydrogenase [synthetic Mycoplasma mycoides JCVI-syn1.0]AMW76746.1 putative D-lactate dehydrogenase [synthetic bacterium JCVI-Syn2.0]ACU78745.1 D-lactate dehydrogenase [Mycoplasma mycoides subsp. capri str. GM12]ACU79576.1 D-lactate dehydrogenase [Mycoplasma mycoides subsp. capri str. GM12]SRX58280.1 lactate dehydrogenase [Mycoplasma mycoides subsp. capri]
MKVIFFGVRDSEVQFFEKLKNKYNYELTLAQGVLTLDRIDLIKDHNCVIVRGADKLDKTLLQAIKDQGVEYVFTRTVGFDHIDIPTGHELGFKMARVASYSPTAIAELAFSLAHSLSRKSSYWAYQSVNKNFKMDQYGFSKELKNSVVGIIGTGRIGYEAAKMFKAFGCEVLGYDIKPNNNFEDVIKYVDLDYALANADILSFHMPYIKGQNDKLINKELISKMKDGAILINTSRGQIQDEQAILDAIKSNKLAGAGLDVWNTEKDYLFKTLDSIDDPVIKGLLDLYPKVLLTPHIGSYTDEAASNMIEYSLDNLNEYLTTGDCKNKL